jgi:hypothetical protein
VWLTGEKVLQDINILDVCKATMTLRYEKALDIASISLYSVAAPALSISPWKTRA